jgi:protein SCO1/2
MTFASGAMALGLLGMPVIVQAHSLGYLEREIQENEQYFQVISKPAPEFDLQDAEGNKSRLVDFRGKVVVLNFIYTRCPDVCPLHTALIAEIQTMVKVAQMQDRVQFVTVTTDPKNDTPKVMQDFGSMHRLDSANWTFLTSGVDQSTATRELVGRFGHKFTETDDGYQVHGVVTHVIDREGRWRANYHGLKFNLTNLILFINALANDSDSHEPAENRTFWEKLWGDEED